MKKNFNKKIALLLSLSLIFSFFIKNEVFADDIQGHWAYDTLKEWKNKDLLKGDENGNVNPDEKITRAGFVALVNRSNKFNEMSDRIENYLDVKVSDWYYDEFSIALNKGYIKGSSDTNLDPNKNITREEAMTIVARIQGLDDIYKLDNEYKDYADVSDWANSSVAACIERAYIKGDLGYLKPKDKISIAETVVLLDRVIKDKIDVDEEENDKKEENKESLKNNKSQDNKDKLADNKDTEKNDSENDEKAPFKYNDIKSIKLNVFKTKMAVGSTETLRVTFDPPSAKDKTILWTSSDENVVFVDDEGKLKALKEGMAVITAKSADNFKDSSCVVEVSPNAVRLENFDLNKDMVSVGIGGSDTLIPTFSPVNATNTKINWSSSDEDIAVVDENGKVTGIYPGQTIIIASSDDGNMMKVCAVEVTLNGKDIKDIKLSQNEITLPVSSTHNLEVMTDPYGISTNLKWSSSNEEVVTVDKNGMITTKAEGSSIIIVKTEDELKMATCIVIVKNNLLEKK